jgi:23S rRNA (adenine2503-C2)-methyltransferase
MQIAEIRHRLRAWGALPLHEAHVLRRWARAQPQERRGRALQDFLPLPLRQALPGLLTELDALATTASTHPAADGSARLLVALADGQTVETVLLSPERAQAVCVSTQVGCAVGCGFCMTGRSGLLRQLGSAEIVAQVVLARRTLQARQPPTAPHPTAAGLQNPLQKVVFMGMGEPAHNLDAVLEAIELLGTLGGIAHKQLVLSTVGDPRLFERLAALGPGQVRPALALSLHSTREALRAELLPRAPRLTPAELVQAAQAYGQASGYPVQYQWTLLEGVNDGDDEIDGIVRLLAGQRAVMNLIPYNTVPELPWRRPARERAAAMARTLHRRGVLTKLRTSAGQDVDAGCGQLRARALPTAAGTAVIAIRRS